MAISIPPVTRTLLFVNIAIYAVQSFTGPMLILPFALWPPASPQFPGAPSFEIWQLLTYGFLHGGPEPPVLQHAGVVHVRRRRRAPAGVAPLPQYYLACVVGAAVAQLIVVGTMDRSPVPTVGASGGVFGLLLAFGMAFPQRRIMLLFPPIPMPAWLFVTLYGVLELYLGVTGSGQGVAHFAHLGGMAAGYVLLVYWRGRPRPRTLRTMSWHRVEAANCAKNRALIDRAKDAV